MKRGAMRIFFSFGLILTVGLLFLPLVSISEVKAKGNLIGFIFEKNGTTPVEGAVVRVQNISTGIMIESTLTDSLGIFKVKGLKNGIYTFGVQTPDGDFNSENLLGISENETAKLSISLSPYESEVAAAVQEAYKDFRTNELGESRVGRVLRYIPETKEAEVFIERGLLHLNDRIHIKGEVTDFYQNVKLLKMDGVSVKRALAGQTAILPVIIPVETDDLVFIVCKRGITPIFLTPLGIASIIAGSTAIVYGIITLTDEGPETSPFKTKK